MTNKIYLSKKKYDMKMSYKLLGDKRKKSNKKIKKRSKKRNIQNAGAANTTSDEGQSANLRRCKNKSCRKELNKNAPSHHNYCSISCKDNKNSRKCQNCLKSIDNKPGYYRYCSKNCQWKKEHKSNVDLDDALNMAIEEIKSSDKSDILSIDDLYEQLKDTTEDIWKKHNTNPYISKYRRQSVGPELKEMINEFLGELGLEEINNIFSLNLEE